MGFFEMLIGEQPGIISTWLNYDNAGQFGEFSTEFALTNNNLSGDFVVLKNVYLPMKGKTTEIDLLMIHEKGIFVFESKNYSGWIFGDAEKLNWTQSLPNGKKYRFYNPIRQNSTHIKALAEYLGKPTEKFISYIIFSERCTLKKTPKSTAEVVILRRPDMLDDLRAKLRNSSVIYTHDEIQAIAERLKGLADKSREEKQEHVDNLKTKCPFCGNDLVLRSGKYGKFWGCSTYPKCRFTRKET